MTIVNKKLIQMVTNMDFEASAQNFKQAPNALNYELLETSMLAHQRAAQMHDADAKHFTDIGVGKWVMHLAEAARADAAKLR